MKIGDGGSVEGDEREGRSRKAISLVIVRERCKDCDQFLIVRACETPSLFFFFFFFPPSFLLLLRCRSGVVFTARLVPALAYRLSPLKRIPRGLKRDEEIADTYTGAVSVEQIRSPHVSGKHVCGRSLERGQAPTENQSAYETR